MLEESEKTLGITQLPIFPLPLVLLPSQILPLHIFEPHYREMLEDIRLKKNLFGISYFEPSEPLSEKPAIDSIGCVAEVKESQTLEDGRSNILTAGIIRYRLKSYVDSDEPYFVVKPKFFEDHKEDESLLNPLADEVFTLFSKIAKAAHKISGQRGAFPDLPKAAPEQLSFLVTAAFDLDNKTKYKMLEMRSTSKRLKTLKKLLLQAVDQAEKSMEIHQVSRTNGHVKKSIDIE